YPPSRESKYLRSVIYIQIMCQVKAKAFISLFFNALEEHSNSHQNIKTPALPKFDSYIDHSCQLWNPGNQAINGLCLEAIAEQTAQALQVSRC
ncbi:MAG: hypothetical protein KJN61_07660, partial [Gammaproteobacteria bacterium]|nr:hypothetical protein [Gammaproteobacteria bacterium]